MKTNSLLRWVSLLFAGFVASCLGPLDQPQVQNGFALSITIPDVGQDYILGQDTVAIIGYKMLIDTLSVNKVGAEDERFEPRIRLASYTLGFAEYYVIGSGIVGGGTFNGVRFAVVRPTFVNNDFSDPDLVDRNDAGTITDTWSISLTGIFDRKFFRFRSKVSKPVQYGFSNSVQLPDYNSYLEARLRGNWRQWFLNSTGTALLNPNDPANSTQIENNILKYFDIFTYSIGEVQ